MPLVSIRQDGLFRCQAVAVVREKVLPQASDGQHREIARSANWTAWEVDAGSPLRQAPSSQKSRVLLDTQIHKPASLARSQEFLSGPAIRV